MRYMGECGCASGMGDLLPTITYPRDIDALKQRLDPDFRATHAVVFTCEGLSPLQRESWARFYATWRVYADTPTGEQLILGVFNSANVYNQGLEYEQRLKAWQGVIKGSCNLASPEVDPGARGRSAESAIKWAAAAAIVVAVVYGVRTFVR